MQASRCLETMKTVCESRIWRRARQCDGLPFNLRVLPCPKTRDCSNPARPAPPSSFFLFSSPHRRHWHPNDPLACCVIPHACAALVMSCCKLPTYRQLAPARVQRVSHSPGWPHSAAPHWHAAWRGNKRLVVKDASQGLGEEKQGVT